MFDEQGYYSEEEERVTISSHTIASSKILKPASNSDFNHLTGDGESLLKMMKERGIDLTDNQVKKLRIKQHSAQKSDKQLKGRSGFFDGGASATLQQLIKALNKALSKADPQQASCILSYILEKGKLSSADLNKFGIMKCKILFGLGAYKDCEGKAQQLIKKASNKLNSAIFSNYLAKCKAQNNKVFEGYLDLLRAKSLIAQVKQQQFQKQKIQNNQQKTTQAASQQSQIDLQRKKLQANFKDSQVDSVIREIDYTEMEYNIKLAEMKNVPNALFPVYTQFKNRKIKQIATGDYHALFLVQGLIEEYSDSTKNVQNNTCSQWNTEVFGIGQNGVGQVLGTPNSVIYKQPVLISQLSGKGITGIAAFRESSLAYNNKGQIFQWGVKEQRNDQISVTYSVGEQVQSLQKGNKHYALLTKSKKFYTWGQIEVKGVNIYKQPQPHMQQSADIVDFSCGNSCIICVDARGYAFALGSNQHGQLCLKGQNAAKNFKKIPDQILGRIRKVFCIGDCTFIVNEDDQIYFTGKYTHNKQPQENIRQAEFSGQVCNLISLCGHIGNYWITNQKGQIYKWDVDSTVKFRLFKQNEQVWQRSVACNRGQIFRIKSEIQPEYCSIQRVTKYPESYQEISFKLILKDRHGLYGNKQFLIAPRCQIHLSTFDMTQNQILKENQEFLERYKLSTSENRILLSQIIDPKLHSYRIQRDQQQPWIFNLSITIDTAGKYFFYVVLQNKLLCSEQLQIEKSAKESQMSQKNLADKKAKEQEKRKRAEEEKRRLLQEKLRKQQQQEQKRKQTQRRAQEALKKHLREQQQVKNKQIQDRRARKQLQTGGGFDLSKLAKKKSTQLKNQTIKSQIESKTSESFMKSTQSFLPDINQRPSSKRKLNFRRESLQSSKNMNPLQKTAGFTNDSKGFLQSKTKDLGKTMMETKTRQLGKTMTDGKPRELTKTIATGKTVLKRGLSRTKK